MSVGSDVQSWATAISTNPNNGRRIVFRYAEQFAPDFDRASQPVRIIVVWKYQSDSGQPVAQEHQQMNLLEDALEPVLEQGRFATLALVSTGENLREWTYYAKSENEFMARLNFALAGVPAFQIEVHIAHDPSWKTYEDFAGGIKKEVVN
jgi:hypothetical protein